MNIFFVISFLIVGVCYALDLSLKLYRKNNYTLQRKPLSKINLTIQEINELIKNTQVTEDHKILFKRYKRFRILGHLILFTIFLVFILKDLII